MLVVLLCLSVVEFFCSILHYPLVGSAFAFICHAWNNPRTLKDNSLQAEKYWHIYDSGSCDLSRESFAILYHIDIVCL